MKKKSSSRKLLRRLPPVGQIIRRNPLRALSLAVITLFLLLLPGQNYYETLHLELEPSPVRASEFDNFSPSLYPERVGREVPPYLSAESVMAVDLASGVPLFELNPDERLRPASITKLMTALVASDYYPPDSILSVKRLTPVPFESDMGLAVGDRVSVRNLLYGLLVPSGGDAAYTLADNYPGGIENFLYSMNKKAENLHMINTHFDNPSGFDSPGQYSSVRDISFLTAAALRNSLIDKIVAAEGVTVSDASGEKSYILKNVNEFLGYLYGADGVKTGFTDQAGQCLVSSITRNGHRIVAVVLHSQDRFGDSARLIEWVFRNFQWIDPERMQ